MARTISTQIFHDAAGNIATWSNNRGDVELREGKFRNKRIIAFHKEAWIIVITGWKSVQFQNKMIETLVYKTDISINPVDFQLVLFLPMESFYCVELTVLSLPLRIKYCVWEEIHSKRSMLRGGENTQAFLVLSLSSVMSISDTFPRKSTHTRFLPLSCISYTFWLLYWLIFCPILCVFLSYSTIAIDRFDCKWTFRREFFSWVTKQTECHATVG